MSRIMIVVEFEVKPEHRNQFIELIKGHAQRSRAEDGCQQFDVLLPQEDHNRVLLVEAWHDQEALESALQTSARYISFIASHAKAQKVITLLSENGVPSETLSRIKAPAGLDSARSRMRFHVVRR